MSAKKTAGKGRIGSSFDDFLKETGDYQAVKAVAIKRVLAWQIAEAMKNAGLTKAELARRMRTSRSQLDRLLNPDNDEVTLSTLARAAAALGREIRLELVAIEDNFGSKLVARRGSIPAVRALDPDLVKGRRDAP